MSSVHAESCSLCDLLHLDLDSLQYLRISLYLFVSVPMSLRVSTDFLMCSRKQTRMGCRPDPSKWYYYNH